MRRSGIGHVLIVTDEPLVSAAILDRVRKVLVGDGVKVNVFDGGEPEPPLEAVGRALEYAQRCRPDAILGLGGGSNIDLAKMTSVALTHGRELRSYFGWDNIPGPVLPIVAMPTTAGTGSEVSASAVLTDAENAIKVSTLSPHLRPALAIVDPELTRSCPRQSTADAGIDALTHAVEAYLATRATDLVLPPGELGPYEGKTPMTDLLAERAIELVGVHLETAVKQPDDLLAREGMALAATLAGMAFSNAGVALVHAMEYPLGGRLHCSHGAGNGLLLPYVMRFNFPVRTQEIARIGQLLGCDRGNGPEENAERAIQRIERLRETIGIPSRIRDLGGTKSQLPDFACKAFAIKRLIALTPRPTTEADVLRLYHDAL